MTNFNVDGGCKLSEASWWKLVMTDHGAVTRVGVSETDTHESYFLQKQNVAEEHESHVYAPAAPLNDNVCVFRLLVI